MSVNSQPELPDPDVVHDMQSLARQIDLLRIRAARGSGSVRVSLATLAKRLRMPQTQRSTLHNYVNGKTLPPADRFDEIVIALGADATELSRWASAWYRVYESRKDVAQAPGQVDLLEDAGPLAQAHAEPSLKDVCRDLLITSSSRDRFMVQIPKLTVPCTMYSAQSDPVTLPDADSAVRDFIAEANSNLLVVFGEFGSGKSKLLREIAESVNIDEYVHPFIFDYADIAGLLRVHALDNALIEYVSQMSHIAGNSLATLLNEAPKRILLLIDGFDEVNHNLEIDRRAGGVAILEPMLRKNVKIVLAARRTMGTTPDDFIEQIGNPLRVTRLGAKGYKLIELRPCLLSEVDRTLSLLPEGRARTMRTYLSTGQHLQMDRIRRPLFIQMLVDMSGNMLSGEEPFSVYRLYEDFVRTTLERDYLSGRSRVPVDAKRRILNQVAASMFDAQSKHAEARLSRDDLQQLVNNEIERRKGEYWVGDAAEQPTQTWARDFMRTNHLLVARSGTINTGHPAVMFLHHSLFEFFLTAHLVSQFNKNGEFGLVDEKHSVRAFDSLLPYFLRSQFGSGFGEPELLHLARRKTASNLDRLLAIFFLEDHPEVVDILHSAPSYRSFLAEAEWTVDSFFMQKVVRFQLILLDRGIGRSFAYVTDLRTREADADQDIEVHTYATKQAPTEYLLKRLANPVIGNGHPILVYRIGLWGNESALETLRLYRETVSDPLFISLIEEAEAKIILRTQDSNV